MITIAVWLFHFCLYEKNTQIDVYRDIKQDNYKKKK